MKQARRPHWYLLSLTIAVGVAGYFGPWVPNRAAGLVILGLDLAEYVKFLPQVRSGQFALQRELFYLPLFAAGLIAALLAGRRTLSGWARVLFFLAAVPLALAMLPPAWTPATFGQSEYRLQTLAIAACLILLPAAALTRYLPDWLVLALAALLSIAAAIMPVWGFLQVKPAIEALYRVSLPPGWGLIACSLGFVAAAVIAVAEMMAPVRQEYL